MGSVRLVGLSGLAGAGKDTVAGMIPNANVVAFAGPLKRFCKEVFDFSEAQVYGPSECRNAPDGRYTRPDGTPLTPRFALQTLGTEWGRNCDPKIWASYGVRQGQRMIRDGARVVLFTDCRFINEAEAIKAAGGEVWQVTRFGAGLGGAAGLHPSEAEQVSIEFQALVDFHIRNNGTKEELRSVVQAVCAARLADSDSREPEACPICGAEVPESLLCRSNSCRFNYYAR